MQEIKIMWKWTKKNMTSEWEQAIKKNKRYMEPLEAGYNSRNVPETIASTASYTRTKQTKKLMRPNGPCCLTWVVKASFQFFLFIKEGADSLCSRWLTWAVLQMCTSYKDSQQLLYILQIKFPQIKTNRRTVSERIWDQDKGLDARMFYFFN